MKIITPYKAQCGLSGQHLIIKLVRSDFEGVEFKDGNSVLPFINCFFEKLTIVNDEEIPFERISLDFFNCILPDITVENIATQNLSLGFYGSIISGKIKNDNLCLVDINNCLTLRSLFLMEIQRIQIRFTKENFKDDQWQRMFIEHYLTEGQELLKKPIRFNLYNPKKVNINSNFEFPHKNFITEILLSFESGEDHQETKISGMSLDMISISGNPAGNLSIENTRIKSWYIHKFTPTGNVSLYSIAPISISDFENKIGIHNSKLDGVEFDNVSFDSYSIISFYRTKFSKAIFTSCDFPEDYDTFSKFVPIENVHYPDERPKNYAKAQYEIFLQLKRALEERGNYYEAQKLQAISHEALRQIKSIPWYDRTILHINNWSNSHGLSVKRPLIGFSLISIPIYLVYLLSINRIFTNTDFDPSLIGYYFSFIDITHRVDFLVDKSEFSWWTLIIDYMGKITVGFFIYQFIAAFRKYGKR
ncbi:hypothetical protein D3C71_27430 [compost metagenome]